MKIETSKVVITEVPGVESITVAPDAPSTYGVYVVIDFKDPSRGFDYAQLTELHAALGEALKYAKSMGTFPLPAPRVWRAGDLQPSDVERVTDKDGEPWRKDPTNPASWLFKDEKPGYGTEWNWIVEEYGPLTEDLG